jgi:hypothetical protein
VTGVVFVQCASVPTWLPGWICSRAVVGAHTCVCCRKKWQNMLLEAGRSALTYFQPTTLRHLAQAISATTCMPVVISRSSCGPGSTLTHVWNSQAGPFLLWNCCKHKQDKGQ